MKKDNKKASILVTKETKQHKGKSKIVENDGEKWMINLEVDIMSAIKWGKKFG